MKIQFTIVHPRDGTHSMLFYYKIQYVHLTLQLFQRVRKLPDKTDL